MNNYLRLLREVVNSPEAEVQWVQNRTGVRTKSTVGALLRYKLPLGFPLVTTKKVFFKGVIHELLWFLKGDTNIKYLQDNGVHIWDEWADSNGDLGPVYGKQWRDFGGVDQIRALIDGLRNDPTSRRHIVSAWNVPDLPKMALAPCHLLFQCVATPIFPRDKEYIGDRYGKGTPEYELSIIVTQRSADLFLGVPFNLASYAALVHALCPIVNMLPGDLIWNGGDCHIYENHIEAVTTQLQRDPFPLPKLTVDTVDDVKDLTFDNFHLTHYLHHPAITAPVAV